MEGDFASVDFDQTQGFVTDLFATAVLPFFLSSPDGFLAKAIDPAAQHVSSLAPLARLMD